MFKNYPQPDDYIPDNRYKCHCKEELTIMPGEYTVHSFAVDFDVEEQMVQYTVMYKLGLNIVIEKHKNELEVVYDQDTGVSIITCKLSPTESLLFKDIVLNAFVQLKFVTKESGVTPYPEISYSEVYPVKLIDALDN